MQIESTSEGTFVEAQESSSEQFAHLEAAFEAGKEAAHLPSPIGLPVPGPTLIVSPYLGLIRFLGEIVSLCPSLRRFKE